MSERENTKTVDNGEGATTIAYEALALCDLGMRSSGARRRRFQPSPRRNACVAQRGSLGSGLAFAHAPVGG